MAWVINENDWSPHFYKHNSKLSTPWSRTRASTKRPSGEAKYKPEVNNKFFETLALKRGSFIYEEPDGLGGGKRTFYYLCADVIGASDGIDTDLIYVEWRCGPPCVYHGYPISEKELSDALKHRKRLRALYKLNRILRPYKKFWNRSQMTTINWSAILGPMVRVHFSSLNSVEIQRPVNLTLSLLEFPHDTYIDVKWSISDKAFIVCLFVNPFTIDSENNILGRVACRTIDRVIATVKQFAEEAIGVASGRAYTRRSQSPMAIRTILFPNQRQSVNSFEGIQGQTREASTV